MTSKLILYTVEPPLNKVPFIFNEFEFESTISIYIIMILSEIVDKSQQFSGFPLS